MTVTCPFDAKVAARKILEDFADTCDDLNIRYALIAGTCLGFYRGGEFIRCDYDIDVWVDCPTPKSGNYIALAKRLAKLGLERLPAFGAPPDFPHHFQRENILLDVWTRNRPFGSNMFLDAFDKITYDNRTYNLPHPIESYLVHVYGGDWRTPKLKCK